MKRAIVFMFVSLLLVGCGGVGYTVKVDSICTQDANAKKTYVLLSGINGVSPTDLQFKEYATYIDRALASGGFTKAKDFNDAKIAIFLVYGIGDPKETQYSYAMPIWGQTGISSAATHGTMSSYGNYGTYSGTTTYTPSYGVTGYVPMVGSITTYFRYFMLDAVDLDEYKKSEKLTPVWKTTVTSSGTSGDLRRVFPVMVAASKPHIGTNTGQQIVIELLEKSDAVMEIKSMK